MKQALSNVCKMDIELAGALLKKYELFETVKSVSPLSGGRQHQVWLVETVQNKFVLKVVSEHCYTGYSNGIHFEKTEILAEFYALKFDFAIRAFKYKKNYIDYSCFRIQHSMILFRKFL